MAGPAEGIAAFLGGAMQGYGSARLDQIKQEKAHQQKLDEDFWNVLVKNPGLAATPEGTKFLQRTGDKSTPEFFAHLATAQQLAEQQKQKTAVETAGLKEKAKQDVLQSPEVVAGAAAKAKAITTGQQQAEDPFIRGRQQAQLAGEQKKEEAMLPKRMAAERQKEIDVATAKHDLAQGYARTPGTTEYEAAVKPYQIQYNKESADYLKGYDHIQNFKSALSDRVDTSNNSPENRQAIIQHDNNLLIAYARVLTNQALRAFELARLTDEPGIIGEVARQFIATQRGVALMPDQRKAIESQGAHIIAGRDKEEAMRRVNTARRLQPAGIQPNDVYDPAKSPYDSTAELAAAVKAGYVSAKPGPLGEPSEADQIHSTLFSGQPIPTPGQP